MTKINSARLGEAVRRRIRCCKPFPVVATATALILFFTCRNTVVSSKFLATTFLLATMDQRSVDDVGRYDDATNLNSLTQTVGAATIANSATRTLSKGEGRFRSFDDSARLFLKDRTYSETIQSMQHKDSSDKHITYSWSCSKWGVVTPILGPTKAVQQVAYMGGWCLVIVADAITPIDYLEKANLTDHKSVHFFSIEKQKQWMEHPDQVGDFAKAIPSKNIARKNLGYLFAMLNGAEFIFDFDDDHFVKRDNTTGGEIFNILPNEKQMENVGVVIQGKNIFNPYPLMGASSTKQSWPRGLPPENIQDSYSQGKVVFSKNISMAKIGVIQLCAERNPDSGDALVKPLPEWEKPSSSSTAYHSIAPPHHVFVPYNAQATIHTASAFWAMLLPSTVPGRVSDIWRSYFSECLFRDLDLGVVFVPPNKVEQIRSAHNLLEDLKEEELDLYFKAGTLVTFLDEWKSELETIPQRMEQLWIDLYGRGYIEVEDVRLVQLWLGALIQGNYKFPSVVNKRIGNVALMGQFNFETPTHQVLLWAQKWRTVFDTVVARGPFGKEQIEELQSNAIEVHHGADDKGYYSPMGNLMETLQKYKYSDAIHGVLYSHDDGLLNMTEISQGRSPFPTQDILTVDRVGYLDPRKQTNKAYLSKFSYKMYPNGTISNFVGQSFTSTKALLPTLGAWGHHSKCLNPQMRLARNPKSDKFREADGSILFSPFVQADFLFVPTRYADEFSEAAQLFIDAGVFLECAFPTIVDMLRQKVNATVRRTTLCTTWDYKKRRRPPLMLKTCHRSKPAYGVYHPVKIGMGMSQWDQVFDSLSASG